MTLENFHLISCHWEGQGVGEDSPHSCTCKMNMNYMKTSPPTLLFRLLL